MRRTYLDYNATAPLRAQARAAMLAAMDLTGNPSSVHSDGRSAGAIVEAAREEVAALAGCTPAEIVFTSGGTEANNHVMRAGWDAIMLSGIEHDSILEPAKASGARLLEAACGTDGIADAGAFAEHVLSGRSGRGRTLATLQLANNETGVLQPIAELAAFMRAHDVVTHCDGVQAAGRVELDFDRLGIDLLTLSAHKIGGPEGIGALVVRRGVDVPALIIGGGQERRRRAGTENVIGIAGFGAAARAAQGEIARTASVAAMRDEIERRLVSETPQAVVVGQESARLPNTTCIACPGLAAEMLVIKLDLAGVSVSAGAACSSGKVAASHVLEAMGLDKTTARGAVRISIGAATTEADIDHLVAAWREATTGKPVRKISGAASRSIGAASQEFAVGEI